MALRLMIRPMAVGVSAITALERVPISIFPPMFRLSIGAVFWSAGLTKVASWLSTVALFQNEYRVPILPPETAAYMATGIELVCPILLWLGVATRLATLPMLAQVLVIQLFVYSEDWVLHLTWASMLLFLLVRGPGVLSVDQLLGQWACKHGWVSNARLPEDLQVVRNVRDHAS